MKIRYYGHVGQPTGYGRAASDLCMALLGAGVSLEIRPMSPPNTRRFSGAFLPLANHVKLEGDLDPHPDAVIVHTIPVDCAKVQHIVMSGPTRTSAPWIAYTTWEALTRPAELRAQFYGFNQVWHPSRANAEALLARGPAKIVPHCFDPKTVLARLGPSDLPRDPNTFYFYYVGAWSERKNPGGVIEAFRHAFGPNDNVALILQCAGANPDAENGPGHLAGVHGAVYRNQRVSDEYILEMPKLYDCFVTASHGEAWNLPCFDAMLAGRQIIAPLGLGSDDYLDETDAGLYGAHRGQLWLEPDLGMLAAAMHATYSQRLRNLTTNYDPVERYGYPAVAQLAENLIAECYS